MILEELKENIKWWESKRWIFNILIGLSFLLGFYSGFSNDEFFWIPEDTMRIVLGIILMNIFYSLGILVEIFDWYYFKNKIKIKRLRIFLFMGGLLLSCLFVFYNAWWYSAKPYLW